MISFSLKGSKNETFRVRYQGRSADGGWIDLEVNEESGQSQIYGIDKDVHRVVIEDVHGIPYNAKAPEGSR